MQNIGINRVSFSTSKYFIDMRDFAIARNQPISKYYDGLMQEKMSIPPTCEDAITLGFSAAKNIMDSYCVENIDLLIFATESGVDESKSCAVYIHKFLNLKNTCKLFDIKQACYAGTAALFVAYDFVRANPGKQVLVIMSDVARYGLYTPGEATQGCGAVALIVSDNPEIAVINPKTGIYADEAMDFWRPVCRKEAIVNGALSAKKYLSFLKKSYENFQAINEIELDYVCFHTPFCKMAQKGHIALYGNADNFNKNSIKYNRLIGNSYTASLYISLISLLANTEEDLSCKNIGLYSYGSGSVSEFFSVRIQSTYRGFLNVSLFEENIESRTKISVQKYEDIYKSYSIDDKKCGDDYYASGELRFVGVLDEMRVYEISNN